MAGPPPGPPAAAARPPAGPPVAAPPAATAPAAVGGAGPKIICPKCGTSNNKGFKFCGSCGHPLAEGPSAPAPAPMAPAPAVGGGGSGTLVLIRPDGTEGESVAIQHQSVLGRATMPQFAADSYLSPRHASFHFGGGSLLVKDEGSLNGIYLRVEAEVPMELEDGTIFRVGQEIVRFERFAAAAPDANGVETMGSPREGLVGRICLITGRQSYGNSYAVPAEGLHLGRERGDILFPDDGYVSGLHARIHSEGGRIFLTDVGSSNGTFIRIENDERVPSGAMLLMGQQLFRVEY
jgi:hypothetical protein